MRAFRALLFGRDSHDAGFVGDLPVQYRLQAAGHGLLAKGAAIEEQLGAVAVGVYIDGDGLARIMGPVPMLDQRSGGGWTGGGVHHGAIAP